ncbi:hypothetical protein QN239_02540 [Mycolicibacterium sp. Y3]
MSTPPLTTGSTPPTRAGALAFDPKAYTENTVTVLTAVGGRTVTYRFYGPCSYVTKPVNADYQSLVISVPINIDGKAIDASNAPIVFANSVGGYMPVSVKDVAGVGEAAMDVGGVPFGSVPPGGEVAAGGNGMLGAGGKQINRAQLAVVADYVVVEPVVVGGLSSTPAVSTTAPQPPRRAIGGPGPVRTVERDVRGVSGFVEGQRAQRILSADRIPLCRLSPHHLPAAVGDSVPQGAARCRPRDLRSERLHSLAVRHGHVLLAGLCNPRRGSQEDAAGTRRTESRNVLPTN